ncbi:glycosyltransferase family 2 protein [Clostridium estertheticum]|uniref:glycosyltransferase family 2 protein n=1 Tax=Clostridium estertheticum TaxID=238834 RepID=UPI001C6F08E5|nr:glycosyltransferase family A protein [Clostridium estertheticum]MBW9173578.1 glycosyltransferase family 2 protein [Clostridium estertheticum]WLC75212.1 glycosyltransferase family 2 protein [Clostridium estertheticum]
MNISVVIPMYNSKDTIINTLNSIKNQTAFEQILEIIVINDGSTDTSLNILKKYIENNENMPIVIINKSNGRVSAARNSGMKVAKGEWIALLDSDDEWLPEKIETQLKIIQDHPEIDFLGGDIDNRGLKILWKRIKGLYKADVKDVCLKMFPQTSVAIFKRSIFEKIGGYDENQSYAEDGNYFLKICTHYNYYHLPVQMVCYGSGKPGFGFSGLSANLKKMYEGNIKNIRELKRDLVISSGFYAFLRVFYWVKYLRRILITKLR